MNLFTFVHKIILGIRILFTHMGNESVFDSVWYSEQYKPLMGWGMFHFAFIGVHRGNRPNSRFDKGAYTIMNLDIDEKKVDPLIHYLFVGWWQKRSMSPADHLQSMLSNTIIQKQKENLNEEEFSPLAMKITWVVPDFQPGLGGHLAIFRMASYLEAHGHDVSILINDPIFHQNPVEASNSINKHFFPFSGKVIFAEKELPRLVGDAVIATDRYSCYAVQKISGFRRKFYFVLDHETEFYPMGTEALIAENTYSMGFDCISCGEWLHQKMINIYGAWSCKWHLAHDRNIYFSQGTNLYSGNSKKVCFYARHTTPRRAVELGFKAFDILSTRGIDFEVYMLGCDLGQITLPYKYKSYPLLNATELAQLYREAAVGMVFSATNHSIMNKEMMACGLPVIDLDVESVRAVFPDGVLKRAKTHPVAIADALEELLKNQDERAGLAVKGISFANQYTWEESGEIIEEAIRERVNATVNGSIPSNA